MRTTTGRGLLAALFAPLLLVAACGDDDDGGVAGGVASPGQFCAQIEAAEDTFDALDDADFDADVFDLAVQTLGNIVPPAEIRDDWTALVDGMSQVADAFRDVDFEDPATLQGLEDLEDTFAGLEGAGDRVTEYISDECGIDLD